jgi:hypothetical protein
MRLRYDPKSRGGALPHAFHLQAEAYVVQKYIENPYTIGGVWCVVHGRELFAGDHC